MEESSQLHVTVLRNFTSVLSDLNGIRILKFKKKSFSSLQSQHCVGSKLVVGVVLYGNEEPGSEDCEGKKL
jgi:hypothetical protein